MTALKKLFVIIICGLTIGAFVPKNCFGLVKDWSKIWGAIKVDHFSYKCSVAIDLSNNTYITGSTSRNFDGQTNYGTYSAFLTKYNSSGEKQWSRIWGATNWSYVTANDLAIGSSNNCYVTGETSASFDGQTTNGSGDIFLTKYNPSGTKIWTRIWGTTEQDNGQSISIDNDGYCYITGNMYGDIDGQSYTGDLFLTKLSSNGTKIWTKKWGSIYNDIGRGVAASEGNIYIAGTTDGEFDGQTNTCIKENDIFLTKFTSDGTRQWSKIWGSEGYDYGEGVAVDPVGNPYVAGFTWGEFDGQTNSKYQSFDICLSKFNSSGTKLWTRIWGNGNPIGAWGTDYAKDVSVDDFGNAYVVGWTDGDFDGQTNVGNYDFFLTKYNSSGTKRWSKIWGTPSFEAAYGVSVNSTGNICYVIGATSAYIFDGQTSSHGSAICLTKFVTSVPPSETFSSANDLANDIGIAEGSNAGATIDPGEPAHAGNGGPYHSVWWNWSEPTAALADEFLDGDTLLVDTHGSDFDTVLAVYTGSAVNNLTQIAANDNSGTGIETSELSFQFNPGVTYHIAVDGKTVSDTGNIVLNYAIIPEPFFLIILLIPPFLKGVRGI